MRNQHTDPGHALTFVQGFRIMIIGVCVAGIGAGWLWDSKVVVRTVTDYWWRGAFRIECDY
jgi:hypothetical protein